MNLHKDLKSMAEAKKADKVIALQKYFIDNITAIDTCREEFRA